MCTTGTKFLICVLAWFSNKRFTVRKSLFFDAIINAVHPICLNMKGTERIVQSLRQQSSNKVSVLIIIALPPIESKQKYPSIKSIPVAFRSYLVLHINLSTMTKKELNGVRGPILCRIHEGGPSIHLQTNTAILKRLSVIDTVEVLRIYLTLKVHESIVFEEQRG